MRLQLSQCLVRPWAASDAASLQRHADNRKVSMHLRDRFPYPYRIEQARAFIELTGREPVPTAWAIEVDGAAVGGIGLQLQNDIERVSGEIGYWLGEPYWGRGIATAAVRAVTPEAFTRFELTRVYAVIFPEHLASIRVLEKAGFAREGHLRQSAIKDGKIRDQLLFAAYRDL